MKPSGCRRFSISVALVFLLVACGGSPAAVVPTTSPGTTSSTSASVSPGTTRVSSPAPSRSSEVASTATTGAEPSRPTDDVDVDTQGSAAIAGSAADALVPFFAAVGEIDGKLQSAAAAVNSGLGDVNATFDQSTIDLVDAAAPWAAAEAIPSGLDPATEQAVLLVYSDLASRFGALRGGDCLQVGTFPRESLNADCFVRGHEAKSRMPGDVRAAEAAAAASGIVLLDPSSPAAAEVPLRVEYINKANLGCGTMGGFIATDAIPIDWSDEPAGDPSLPPTDGNVNGIRFRAAYSESAGWTVNLLAC